jgi:hypothetical protein
MSSPTETKFGQVQSIGEMSDTFIELKFIIVKLGFYTLPSALAQEEKYKLKRL